MSLEIIDWEYTCIECENKVSRLMYECVEEQACYSNDGTEHIHQFQYCDQCCGITEEHYELC